MGGGQRKGCHCDGHRLGGLNTPVHSPAVPGVSSVTAARAGPPRWAAGGGRGVRCLLSFQKVTRPIRSGPSLATSVTSLGPVGAPSPVRSAEGRGVSAGRGGAAAPDGRRGIRAAVRDGPLREGCDRELGRQTEVRVNPAGDRDFGGGGHLSKARGAPGSRTLSQGPGARGARSGG